MIKKQKLLTLVVFILSSIFLTLCTNPTEPKEKLLPEKEYEPGTRDYVWSIDTLNIDAPLNYYTKIWGSSPNDIWIVGQGGDPAKRVIRFNGASLYYFGPNDQSFEARSVFGFTQSEIWIGGENFDFWHSSGDNITLNSEHVLQGFREGNISDIWGDSQSNIFAVGGSVHIEEKIYAILLNFNGNVWNYASDPIFNLQFQTIRKDQYNSDYYILALRVNPPNPDSAYFYKYDGFSLKKVFITDSINPLAKQIFLMDGTIYFIQDKEIYKLWNGKINKKISLYRTNVTGVKVFGRNESDFFVQCEGGIGHYNGINFELVYNIEERFGIVDGIVIENDVFFMGFYIDSFKFFFIRGNSNK